MKNNFEPIPTPKAQLWKEFRVAYLPWIVMVVSVCITWLVWSRVAVAPTMMGEVEVVRAQIVCPEVGIVRNVLADRFAEVKAGDPLVEVQLTDRRSILDAIRIELGMLDSNRQTDAELTLQRAQADYYGLRFDLLEKQVEYEQAKVELDRAEKDLVRNQSLMEQNYVTKEIYDASLAARDTARKTAEELGAILPKLAENVESLHASIENLSNKTTEAYDMKLVELEAKLAAVGASSDSTLTLTSPIDGMISGVWCSPGESVPEGTVLMMVNATQPQRIVAYMRQPFPVEPKAGMPAKIITHSKVQPVLVDTEVETVGLFLEPITNSLARLSSEKTVDMGLPVSFKVPEGLELRPGETVGLLIR